jgi:ABC-type branched-subunit amino acid transport system substrate-binding protein
MRRLAVILSVVALVAAACSRDDSGSSSDDSDTSTDAATDDAADFASLDSDEIGTLAWPCGPQDGGGELPTSNPDEVQGITNDSIKVGTIADPGYEAIPGLNQEMFDIAEAFVAECNERGGVNGRELDLTLRDAALFDYAPRVDEACAEDFALVGSGATFDDTGAQAMTDCGLVAVPGFNVTAPASLADNTVQPLPNPPEVKPGSAFAKVIEELEAGAVEGDPDDIITNSGILYGDTQTTIDTADQYVKTAEEYGFEFVYDESYNILGESNWQPFVAAMQDAGVEILTFVGSPDFFIELQEAMDEFGFAPRIIMQQPNFYDADYAQGVGGLNPDTLNLVAGAFWPYERADENPATQVYVDLLTKHVPDADIAYLGLQGLSAWLLFATAATECGRADDLSRSCVYDTAKGFDDWDGGGLHTAANPADFLPPECTLILEVTDDGTFAIWEPDGETPDDAYFCDPDSIIEIEGDYGEGVTRQG